MKREHPGNRPGLAELLFFETHPEALPLYEAFREKILERCPEATLEVKKTQISFFLGAAIIAVMAVIALVWGGQQNKSENQ